MLENAQQMLWMKSTHNNTYAILRCIIAMKYITDMMKRHIKYPITVIKNQ